MRLYVDESKLSGNGIRYWDSSCFLAWLKEEKDRVSQCGQVLDLVQCGKIELVTSTLTVAEVIQVKKKDKLPKGKRSNVEDLFNRPSIKMTALSLPIAIKARDVVWDHGIDPKDAVHVATAIVRKAKILETFDKDLISRGNSIGSDLLFREPEVKEPRLELTGPGRP